MKKISAGLLMYRYRSNQLEVFLAHPGGPYLKNKDAGYWGLPKGAVEPDETLLEAATREFHEETGILPHGTYIPLGSVMLISGKVVYAWAFEGDWDECVPLKSNLFSLEWPPHSGKEEWFPEIDKAAFFRVAVAHQKINPAQGEFINRLENYLAAGQQSDKTT